MNKVLLPEGWIWRKLGDICLKVDKTASKSNQPESEFSYIDIDAVDNNVYSIVNPKTYFWKDAPSRAQQVVRAGDVIFSTVRTYLKNIALVPDKLDGQIASTGFCVLRSENVDSKYLFYYVLTEGFLRALNEIQRGTSYPAVRNSDVLDQEIPLPPLPVQRQIVARIEELFSELDAGTQELQTALKRLKTYRQAVLHHYLSNEEWKMTEIGKVCGCIVPNRDKPKSFTGDTPWITIPDLAENRISISYKEVKQGLTGDEIDESRAKVIPIGSVIMTCVGRFGIAAVVERPLVINQQLHAFLPSPNYNSKFIAYSIIYNKSYFEQEATATTIAYINKSKCNGMPIPVISLDIQNRIVAEIEAKLSEADAMEAAIRQSLQQAEALRQSILKRAFEGKLLTDLTSVETISDELTASISPDVKQPQQLALFD